MHQGLAVADVQVAVGLRRETGVDGHTFVLTAGGNVLVDKGVDKIAVFRGLDFFCHSFRPLRRHSGAIIVSIGILYPKECGGAILNCIFYTNLEGLAPVRIPCPSRRRLQTAEKVNNL